MFWKGKRNKTLKLGEKNKSSFKLNPASYNNVTEMLLNPFQGTIALTYYLTAIQQHSTPSTDNSVQTDLTLPRCLYGKDQEKADDRLKLFTIYKKFQENPTLKSKRSTTFWVVPVETLRKQRNI